MNLFFVLTLCLSLTISESLETYERMTRENQEYASPCEVDGQLYQPAERIPTKHVCHVCLCRFGKPECYWMDCPPPPEGCYVFPAEGTCNPQLYVCKIPDDLVGDTSYLRETGPGKEKRKGDCYVRGVPYLTGELMGIATSFCMECRCARQNLYCSPKCCFSHAGYNDSIGDILLRAIQRGSPQEPMHPLQYLYYFKKQN